MSEYNYCVTQVSMQLGKLDIISIYKEHFSKVLKEEIEKISDNEYKAAFFDGTDMVISILEKEKVKEQVRGMSAFYSKISIENQELKRSIMKQISMFNSIIYFKFNVDQNNQRTNSLVNNLFKVAKFSSALLMFQDLRIYTPEKKLLIDLKGKTDYTEYYPIARRDPSLTVENLADKFDMKRINKNIAKLKEMGLPYAEGMTDIPFDKNTSLMDKDNVIIECIISYTLASLASSLNGEKNDEMYTDIYNKLNSLYFLENKLPENCKEILNALKNGEYEKWQTLTWEYEFVGIFLWGLSLIDFPSQEEEIDVNKLNEILYYTQDVNELFKKAKLRSKAEILEKTDLLSRYKWACEEFRIKKIESDSKLNELVISKQLHALKFLLSGKRTVLEEIIRRLKTEEKTYAEFLGMLLSNKDKIQLYRPLLYENKIITTDENGNKIIDKSSTFKDLLVDYLGRESKVFPIFSSKYYMAEYMKEDYVISVIKINDILNWDGDFAIDIGRENECVIYVKKLKEIYNSQKDLKENQS